MNVSTRFRPRHSFRPISGRSLWQREEKEEEEEEEEAVIARHKRGTKRNKNRCWGKKDEIWRLCLVKEHNVKVGHGRRRNTCQGGAGIKLREAGGCLFLPPCFCHLPHLAFSRPSKLRLRTSPESSRFADKVSFQKLDQEHLPWEMANFRGGNKKGQKK